MKIFGWDITREIILSIIGFIIITIVPITISVIAIIHSYKANDLSEALNRIEVTRDDLEYKKGKVALLSFVAQYFILNFQRSEYCGNTYKVKTESPYLENYIEEIEILSHKFDNIINNPYYMRLFEKYPFIFSISIFLRKEIMFINESKSKNKGFGYSNEVWGKMYDMFSSLRNEIMSEKETSSVQGLIESKEFVGIFEYAENVNNSFNKQNK
ncbi:MAG: hypothetical protein ACYDEE_08905 [Ignavibacteriaceae bacterium]